MNAQQALVQFTKSIPLVARGIAPFTLPSFCKNVRKSDRSIFLVLLAATLVTTACLKESDWPGLRDQSGYFPLIVGQWIEYEVDSIKINGMTTDSSRWYVLEKTEAMYSGTEAQPSFRLHRYYKRDLLAAYPPYPVVWTASVSSSHALKTEENVTYQKLVFPLGEGSSWDGNAFNSLSSETYHCTAIDVPLTLNAHAFDRSLTVVQREMETLISKDYREEIFAFGVGLVASEEVHLLNLQSSQYKSGHIVRYRLLDFHSSMKKK